MAIKGKQFNFWLGILLAIGTIIVLIYLWSAILPPFFMAAIFAYLGNPLVSKIMRYKLPRLLAVVMVFTIMIVTLLLMVLLLIPMIQTQLSVLTTLIPKIIQWAQEVVFPFLQAKFGPHHVDALQLQTAIKDNWRSAGNVISSVVTTLSHSSWWLVSWLTNLLLIPVVTFYLLRDWHLVLENGEKLLPRRLAPTLTQLASECNEVLGAFFRGQLLVMLALGLIYAMGLSLIGLQVALLIGLMAGLLSIVPYLGFIVGLGAAIVAALLQFHQVHYLSYVMMVFVAGQVLEGMVLTPSLVGDKIGLHPVAVIFAILAGGEMFGFIGILLALPVAAVIMVLLRFGYKRYLNSELYTAFL